jgi:anhydro-N-acetylmuramic acid kinase
MISKNKTWTIAGLMSGTSLDGLDIAVCRFKSNGGYWRHEILAATTIPYPAAFRQKLQNLPSGTALELAKMDADFGKFCGEQVKNFLAHQKLRCDFVASHGHTIFHQPDHNLTTQIGNGAQLSAAAGLPVVCDFRTLDVALGGQGAPLVPIGDQLLFGDYTYCLNLGGIANISFQKKNKRIAGDICPVNIVLNALAAEKKQSYDKDGKMAASGQVDATLLRKLNALTFYKKDFPKSLGREWIDRSVFPLLAKSNLSTEDKAATFCEHIALQIAAFVQPDSADSSLLITGGGALHRFLIRRLKAHLPTNTTLVLPDKNTIAYKEALIFAFLGLHRMVGIPNALKSVTGASKDSIGGALYGFVKKQLS